jgi:MoxR-like ATPase
MKKLSTKDQETKKVLEGIITRYKDDLDAEGEKGIKANNMTNTAKMKLANLLGETATPIPTPKPSSSSGSDAISEALNSIQEALNLLEGGGSINEAEVKRIFNESSVDLSQLSPEILELINKNRKIILQSFESAVVELDKKPPEIFWTALADLQAHNNVYLYGGAGTGKTYISNVLAKALNCTLITINCNQYTSPLEILGGQTIEGYQEGKLITAWANLTTSDEGVNGGMKAGTTGCLLLLDELPKIDPNTAGLLNDALAKIKDTGESSEIQNSRGNSFEKKRFFCIATGNSKLNEESADYVANFKQDLSLQDRFSGSTYKIFVDLEVEYSLISGYLFIFNFLNKIRDLIESDEGIRRQLGQKAFVSIRVMLSLRDNWIYWYENHKKYQVKSLKEGIVSFLDLFTQSQKEYIIQQIDLPNFYAEIDRKATQPLGTNTEQEEKEAQVYIKAYVDKRTERSLGK